MDWAINTGNNCQRELRRGPISPFSLFGSRLKCNVLYVRSCPTPPQSIMEAGVVWFCVILLTVNLTRMKKSLAEVAIKEGGVNQTISYTPPLSWNGKQNWTMDKWDLFYYQWTINYLLCYLHTIYLGCGVITLYSCQCMCVAAARQPL